MPWIAKSILAAIIAERSGLSPLPFILLTAILWLLLWSGMKTVFLVLLQSEGQWPLYSAADQDRWIRTEWGDWFARSVYGTIFGLWIGLVVRDQRSFFSSTISGARYLIRSTPVGWSMLAGFLCSMLFLAIDTIMLQLRDVLGPDWGSILHGVPRFFVVSGLYAWALCSILGLLIGAAVGCVFWAFQHRARQSTMRRCE